MLCAAGYCYFKPCFFCFCLYFLNCVFKICCAFTLFLRNYRFNLLKSRRVCIFKAKVFKFIFRCRQLPLSCRFYVADVADFIQTVCNFYKDYAYVFGHCKKHLADCICLLKSLWVYRYIMNLWSSVYYGSNVFSEFLLNLFFCNVLFVNVMQKSGNNAVGIKVILCKNKCNS